jgi:hypothetical protein
MREALEKKESKKQHDKRASKRKMTLSYLPSNENELQVGRSRRLPKFIIPSPFEHLPQGISDFKFLLYYATMDRLVPFFRVMGPLGFKMK